MPAGEHDETSPCNIEPGFSLFDHLHTSQLMLFWAFHLFSAIPFLGLTLPHSQFTLPPSEYDTRGLLLLFLLVLFLVMFLLPSFCSVSSFFFRLFFLLWYPFLFFWPRFFFLIQACLLMMTFLLLRYRFFLFFQYPFLFSPCISFFFLFLSYDIIASSPTIVGVAFLLLLLYHFSLSSNIVSPSTSWSI